MSCVTCFLIPLKFKRFCVSALTIFATITLSSCIIFHDTPFQEYSCATTSKLKTAPQQLKNSCLYSDIGQLKVSSELRKFTPNYQLWSDGSKKSRWIYLPENTQINTQNPDRWTFPLGTQIFKEFRRAKAGTGEEIKIETRHLKKIASTTGIDSWLISTYKWNIEQTEAWLSQGEANVLDTDHDIPSRQECVDCHKGNTDIILGFEAIQLSDKQEKNAFGHGPKRGPGEWTLQGLIDANRLSHPIEMPLLPGSPLEQKALGYLHANCGNCHNPLGFAADNEANHLKMRHKLSFTQLTETDVYTTAVNQPTRNFTAVPYIILGASDEELALYHSAAFVRMNSTDENYRMPPIARKNVDYQALDLIHKWMQGLPTPAEFQIQMDSSKNTQAENKVFTDRSQPLSGPGLQVEIQFFEKRFIPPVMALYWPEDSSLENTPVVDQKNGYFTEKLILAPQGSTMSLLNSDDVGHTIYAKDKQHGIKWQLNYMPPNSSFKQPLFWGEDVFVELRCRLHLYMSAWVGSIRSQYSQIVKLKQAESYKHVQMHNYPEHFKQLKIWLPKFKLIDTQIGVGDEQTFELKKGDQVQGKIRIKRSAQ